MVWNKLMMTACLNSDRFTGLKKCPEVKLPNAITIIPARKKRQPANKIWAAASKDPIRNHSYPILIPGKALPQKKQLIDANKHTTQVFFNILCIFQFQSVKIIMCDTNLRSSEQMHSKRSLLPSHDLQSCSIHVSYCNKRSLHG